MQSSARRGRVKAKKKKKKRKLSMATCFELFGDVTVLETSHLSPCIKGTLAWKTRCQCLITKQGPGDGARKLITNFRTREKVGLQERAAARS